MKTLCSTCGTLTSLRGGKCVEHRHATKRSRHTESYSTKAWTTLSRRILAAHPGEYGELCPGDGAEHQPHATSDLTVDHRLPRIHR